MFPIDRVAARSLALLLSTVLVACSSDDDDEDPASAAPIEQGPTADDPGDGLPGTPEPITGDTLPDGDAADAVPATGDGTDGGTDGGATGVDEPETAAPVGGGTGVGGPDVVESDVDGADGGATDATGTDADEPQTGMPDAGETGSDDSGADGTADADVGADGGIDSSEPGGTDGGDADGGATDDGADSGVTDGGADADAAQPPGARAPVSIAAFDPATDGVPVIDGSFDEVWQRATFADESGESLLIDRLLIDAGAEAPDGGVPYVWFAMHDSESLYLFVQFERSAPYTPIRDSERFFDDDAVNLFFDGDGSRGEGLEGTEGGDDRYVVIPLLARDGEERPEAFAPLSGTAPEVPPSLEYGVCVCEGSVTGWEMKIALSDLNVEVGRPFGFEVQIDQDLDGGERDARWGWSNPAPAMGGTFVPESPALSGSVTLVP